jgi:DNA helicase TIP49 (TBP-interacting protein)
MKVLHIKLQEIEMNNGQSQSHNIMMKELKRICTKEVRKEINTTYKTTCDDGSYKSKVQKISTMVIVFCNQCH